jgi:hypothetical protein
MDSRLLISALFILSAWIGARAQDPPTSEETRFKTRYSVSVIDDATFYGNRTQPGPGVLNQVLLEPSFSLHYRDRLTISSSVIGLAGTYFDNYTQLRIKETYADLSAGDFDITLGRKMVRWGTGYAFTAAGVLDPPRIATNPTDRLNVNEGRDMIKGDWVHGPHAISLAWSTAALASAQTNMHDTTAFGYNVLVRGFDTSLIAGDDRGADTFGALTFTRVFGQALEVHGEAVWREQAAVLLGGKYSTGSGITFLGEFYSPPNIPYYRGMGVSTFAGRQHYAFLYAGKARLRELPGWKEWGLSGSAVTNLDDRSYTTVFDASRWFGNHFSAYLHMETPRGGKASQYSSAPYTTGTSVGVRFQL